jgi:hypothetical protein
MTKPILKSGLVGIAIAMAANFSGAVTGQPAIDYKAFLGRHDLVWDRIPNRWEVAPYTGNGNVGFLFYQAQGAAKNVISIYAGRHDYYDHRLPTVGTEQMLWIYRSRLPLGHFKLESKGSITGVDLRLGLWNAELTGTVKTSQGSYRVHGLSHSQTDIPKPKVYINGAPAGKSQVQVDDADIYQIELKKGDRVTFTLVALEQTDLSIAPIPVSEADITLAALPFVLNAQDQVVPGWKINPDKELNPNTRWLRDAKWGLFSHYMVHRPSGPVPEHMTGELWNKKVNSFQIRKFGDQLSELKVPYFFITIGQGGGYYCSPNETYERLFGPSNGKLSERDLVAELAAELIPRGIKMCVYLPALGRRDSADKQQMYREVISEWSKRWGESVSAWWIDGAVFESSEVYKAYTEAFKAGNPNALVSYNVGPVGMGRKQLVPVTEHEDFLAGECDYVLPTCATVPSDLGKHFNVFADSDYYRGPNISGDQLHFLNFLGSWWSTGEPRFADELVIGWTKHVIDHSGAVTWDLPLSDAGIIPENYFNQVKALSESINKE